ncbi:MAG: glycosyltransferase family 4 protein [Methanomicrobiales archaeon]|nr:glycosyltransferase family 4 protein [Methanomicrobiales archaeon]
MSCSKKINVIVLDVHHPEDGRINRHIKYITNLGYIVFHININRYFSFLESGNFSRYGENGYRITIGNTSETSKNRIFLQFLFVSPLLSLKIITILKKIHYNPSIPTIIHIHDYELLITAQYLRFFLHGFIKIVYDRHEYLEILKGKNILFDYIPLFYEKFSKKRIDGLVDISESHLEKIKSQFTFSKKIVIPNYPDPSFIKFIGMNNKIKKIDENKISIVYFGSLDISLDRDIYLTLEVMESVIQKNCDGKAYVGGLTSDYLILARLNQLMLKYPNQFFYLGYVLNQDVLSYTSNATLGLFLLKSSNSVSGSSNKIYEYLMYGVIPIIKGNIENLDQIRDCSLIFSGNEKNDMIISKVDDLVADKHMMKLMSYKSWENGKIFSFDHVKERYSNLYNDILNIKI